MIPAASARRAKQLKEIPSDWLLKSPPQDHNVIDVPASSGLLSHNELLITETKDIEVLLSNLHQGVWSSVDVTTAFYKRAIIAHQLTNCLTEIFIDEALERAKFLDDYLARTKSPIGPLHGLPISLKDQFCMKGKETIMGYASWIDKVAERDSALVEVLYEAGAVPFVRTNVPQTLWWGETFNNVFGRTLNPYNRALTIGGSSGGEAALLALRGSPLGVGTDIGGSVRIPTSFAGLYSLRPSMHRLPYGGLMNSAMGQESIHSVMGPMAPSIEACTIFTKAVVDGKPWNKDPTCLRIPWNTDLANLSEHGGKEGKLCLAMMYDSDIVQLTPPVKRAMDITKKALQDAGHTVIEWENYKHLDIHINMHVIFGADGGEDVIKATEESGEPLISTMLPSNDEAETFDYLFGRIPLVDDGLLSRKPLAEPMERHVLSPSNTTEEAIESLKRVYQQTDDNAPIEFDDADIEPKSFGTGTDVKPKSAWEIWKLHAERRTLQKEYLDHWNRTAEKTGTGRPVDAIISPVAAYPAPPHGYNSDAFYTSLWNALDYAACTFPVTTVDPELDVRVPRHHFHNHEDEHVYRWYDPHIFKDAPVGLQLVGRTHEEEAVLSMTRVVDQAIKRAAAAS